MKRFLAAGASLAAVVLTAVFAGNVTLAGAAAPPDLLLETFTAPVPAYGTQQGGSPTLSNTVLDGNGTYRIVVSGAVTVNAGSNGSYTVDPLYCFQGAGPSYSCYGTPPTKYNNLLTFGFGHYEGLPADHLDDPFGGPYTELPYSANHTYDITFINTNGPSQLGAYLWNVANGVNSTETGSYTIQLYGYTRPQTPPAPAPSPPPPTSPAPSTQGGSGTTGGGGTTGGSGTTGASGINNSGPISLAASFVSRRHPIRQGNIEVILDCRGPFNSCQVLGNTVTYLPRSGAARRAQSVGAAARRRYKAIEGRIIDRRIPANQKLRLKLPLPASALRAIRHRRVRGKATRVEASIQVANPTGNKYDHAYISANAR